MLGDEQNTIHGQRARSQGERVGDISSDPEPVGGGQEPTDVVGRPLLDIERGQLQRRLFPCAVEHVRQEQSTGDDICMGIVTVHRGENRDPLLRLQRSHRFPCRVEAGHQDSKKKPKLKFGRKRTLQDLFSEGFAAGTYYTNEMHKVLEKLHDQDMNIIMFTDADLVDDKNVTKFYRLAKKKKGSDLNLKLA